MALPSTPTVSQKSQVPVVALSLPADLCAEALWEAATNYGFFTIINHGIPQEFVDSLFSSSEQYFQQPCSEKNIDSPFDLRAICGYDRLRKEERKECFIVRARAGCMDKMWPDAIPTLKDNMQRLMEVGHTLAKHILGLLEPRACPSLKPGTLAASTQLWGEEGYCGMGIIHYPGETGVANLDPDVWRFHPHTDLGLITLVFQRPGQSGLECADLCSGQGGWLKVEPAPGAITVNVGDMLEYWSDRRLRSNLHRVVAPPSEVGQMQPPRYSIALHVAADRDVILETESSEPITAAKFVKPGLPERFPGVILDDLVYTDKGSSALEANDKTTKGGA
jgi:isopenicillin N synthase-like dioxygenase